MKKYYYKSKDYACLESCTVGEAKIGSFNCKKSCTHCKGFDSEENWIKCEIMPDGNEVAGPSPVFNKSNDTEQPPMKLVIYDELDIKRALAATSCLSVLWDMD